MTERPIYIFVCGISNWPGSNKGWTDQAVEWANAQDLQCDKLEYFTTPVTRWMRQDGRIADLITKIRKYRNHPIILVAHSNGCEVACHALLQSDVMGVKCHFISGACAADFNENGLNALLRTGKVSDVTVYRAGKDWAMFFAQVSRFLLKWAGLGYGTLGKHGPQNMATDVASKVRVVYAADYGHSTWFEPKHFDQTMRMVCGDLKPET